MAVCHIKLQTRLPKNMYRYLSRDFYNVAYSEVKEFEKSAFGNAFLFSTDNQSPR